MKTWKKSLGCMAAALVLTPVVWTYANEDADALRAAPPAVQVAVVQLVGTSKISEFDSETENGKTVYDIGYSVKGVGYEADIDPSGEILTREVEVDLSIVPPAVTAAAKAAHADGKIGEASIVTAGDRMYYELDVKIGKDEREMQIGAGGSVIADSVEAPEAPEADEGGKAGEKGEKEDKD